MPPVHDDRLYCPTVRLSLAYSPPLEWGSLLGYLAARATPGIEAVDAGGRYCRSIRLHGHPGYVVVGPAAVGAVLPVELTTSLLPVLVPLLARLRRLFDLDADPRAIAEHLGGDSVLGPLVARRPGLRVPGAGDGFELALRAVLGQQVTVRGATTLAGRLARILGEPLPGAPPPLAYLPISADRLAGASLASVSGIGLPRARAACLLALARAVADGELPELASDGWGEDPAAFGRRFRDLPGIGAWTAEYVSMRALRWADAFPEGDIGLRKAMGGLSPARLRAAAESWRPWRAYAAQHLWASLADSPSRGSREAPHGCLPGATRATRSPAGPTASPSFQLPKTLSIRCVHVSIGDRRVGNREMMVERAVQGVEDYILVQPGPELTGGDAEPEHLPGELSAWPYSSAQYASTRPGSA